GRPRGRAGGCSRGQEARRPAEPSHAGPPPWDDPRARSSAMSQAAPRRRARRSHHGRTMRATSGALVLGLAAAGLLATAPAGAVGEDAAALAATLNAAPGLVTGAEFVEGPPDPSAVSVGTTPVAGFPR